MKTTELLCFLVALYQTDFVVARSIQAQESDLTREEESCVNELQLNKNEIQVMNNRDIAPEDNEDFDKFLSCYWKKMNWEQADGTINYEILEEDIFQTITSEIEDLDAQIKLMLKLLLQKSILNCKNRATNFTVPKIQNCIIKDFENLTGYTD